jgi:solute carrier family 10 (sodium/bile acid cotransporter), member 7
VTTWLGRNWYLVAFLSCIAAAWARPAIGASGGPLHPQAVKPALIAGIFLMCGLALPTRALRTALGRVRVHAFVQAFNLAAIPAVFLALDAVLTVFGLPAPLRSGLLLAACLPTTISTCVALTKLSGGDEAVAVCNSTIGNLLGLVATPLLVLGVTGHHASLPAHEIVAQLGMMVGLPLAIGQLARLPFERWMAPARRGFATATSLLLLSLIYLVFCDSFASGLRVGAAPLAATAVILAVAYPLLLGAAFIASSWSVLAMDRSQRVAAAICSTHKTAVLGVPMLSIIYAGDPQLPLMTLPLLLYHFLQLFIGTALAPRLRAWVDGQQDSRARAA